jgi:Family of unknown function (DUF5654)
MSRRQEIRNRSLQTFRAFLQTMITLATASLGFVSALAWNDAIKETFKQYLGESGSLSGLYTYAALATVTAIIVVATLSWLASKIGGEAAIDREVDG